MDTITRPVVLVPCTETLEHAKRRPEDCPVCGGRGLRPAGAIEYVYCDNRHELELTKEDDGPALDGYAPDGEDECGYVWQCPVPRCDDTVILDKRDADQ